MLILSTHVAVLENLPESIILKIHFFFVVRAVAKFGIYLIFHSHLSSHYSSCMPLDFSMSNHALTVTTLLRSYIKTYDQVSFDLAGKIIENL